MKDEFGTYPYTCKSTSSTASCQVLIKVNSLVSETSAKVQYYSYSSTSLDGTRTNEVSSNAKTQLNKWYAKNIVKNIDEDGNLLTNYVVDAKFCNDRNITDKKIYNLEYKLNQDIFYSAYIRLYQNSDKVVTLKCSNDIRDQFSTTSSRGNAKFFNNSR